VAEQKVGNGWQLYLMRVAVGEETGFRAILVRLGLDLLEIIYLVLLKLNFHLTRRFRLPVPVISVGNITAGGTGKTPLVVWLAGLCIQEGLTPAILTRGYGGKRQKEGVIFRFSDLAGLSPAETGDEPFLLAKLLPEALVVVGRERYRMGLKALKVYPEIDLFILDDGFQHWELKRNLDLLVIDASKPFSNGHLLPRGLLREPLSSLKRAGIILLTRTGKLAEDEIANLTLECKRHNPDVSVALVREDNPYLISLNGVSKVSAAQFLAGRKVGAITGIGNPRQFLGSLESLGAEVGYFKGYPDHYQWEKTEIDNLLEVLKEWGFKELIVTAKDGVKLEPYLENFLRYGMDCYVLTQEFAVNDPSVVEKIKLCIS
jgi:tetraacyldisaccharide 4'-kinase